MDLIPIAPPADRFGLNGILGNLTQATQLYSAFQTMQNNNKIANATTDLQIAQAKAQVARLNQPTYAQQPGNQNQPQPQSNNTLLIVGGLVVVGGLVFAAMKGKA